MYFWFLGIRKHFFFPTINWRLKLKYSFLLDANNDKNIHFVFFFIFPTYHKTVNFHNFLLLTSFNLTANFYLCLLFHVIKARKKVFNWFFSLIIKNAVYTRFILNRFLGTMCLKSGILWKIFRQKHEKSIINC